jgi:hypothetical protein
MAIAKNRRDPYSWPPEYFALLRKALAEPGTRLSFPTEASRHAFRMDFYKFLQAVRTGGHPEAPEAQRIEIRAEAPFDLVFLDRSAGKWAGMLRDQLSMGAVEVPNPEALLEKLKGLEK